MTENYLLLKWGSLKGWNLDNNNEAFDLLKQWHEIGTSLSAMVQHDTPEQKDILVKLIQAHTGTITNDWDGEEYTKDRAIDYIRNYGSKL